MAKAPAYQWFPKDAATDETFRLMSYEQQGIYRALLDHQWMEGSIPADLQVIASLLRVDLRRLRRLWPGISRKFSSTENGRLYNDRLERQRVEAEAYVENQAKKGRKAATARWGSGNRGNAHALTVAQPDSNSASASASASAKHTRTSVSKNMDDPGRFLEWWSYTAYPEHRNGAAYVGNMRTDYDALTQLCAIYSLDRLKQLAEVFLQIPGDKDKFLDSGGGRSLGKFRSYASKIDERLKQREAS